MNESGFDLREASDVTSMMDQSTTYHRHLHHDKICTTRMNNAMQTSLGHQCVRTSQSCNSYTRSNDLERKDTETGEFLMEYVGR